MYQQFVSSLNSLDSADVNTKNQAFTQLYALSGRRDAWVMFPQMLQSGQDQQIFYGLKFAENLIFAHAQELLPNVQHLRYFCYTITQSGEQRHIVLKAAQILFYLCYFGLADFQETVLFFIALERTPIAAQCLTQMAYELYANCIRNVPKAITRRFNSLLVEFFSSPQFQQFSMRISCAEDAVCIARLLECAAASYKGVMEFVFANMTFCKPEMLSQEANASFFAYLLRIAAACQGFGAFSQGILRYNELFWIVCLCCRQIQAGNGSYSVLREIPFFAENCVFSEQFSVLLDYSIHQQINKTLTADPVVLHKQRNVAKMDTTIYSSVCGVVECFPAIYKSAITANDSNLAVATLQCALHACYLKLEKQAKKYVDEMFREPFGQLLSLILESVQRPQEIVYFKNEFGEVLKERIDESCLIYLNAAQLSAVTAIVGYFGLHQMYTDRIIYMTKQYDLRTIQNLSYVFPAVQLAADVKYVKNPKFKHNFVYNTLSLYLTLSDAIHQPADKLIASYCSIYVASKSVNYLSNQLRLAYIEKAFDYLRYRVAELSEASVQLLIALFYALNMRDIEYRYYELFEQRILLPLFEVATSLLDQWQTRDLYSAVTSVVYVDSWLAILLFPIQNYISTLMGELNQREQSVLLYENSILHLLNVFQIINACCTTLVPQSLDNLVQPIFPYIQTLWNFYFMHQSECGRIVWGLIRVIYQVLRYIMTRLSKAELESGYSAFVAYIIAAEGTRLQQFCQLSEPLRVEFVQFFELLVPYADHFAHLLTCYTQLQKTTSESEVINTFYQAFISYFENGAYGFHHLEEGYRAQMLNMFCVVTTEAAFLTHYTSQLLARYAETLNFCVIRKSGKQFAIQYLQRLIASKFIANVDFVVNVFQYLRAIVGDQAVMYVCQQSIALFYEEIVAEVLRGNAEAVEDLRIICY